MGLKKLNKDEIEQLSYPDIAVIIMEDRKTKIKIKDLFEKIGKLLGFSKRQYEAKIGVFYTTITTDKRFVVLDGGAVDLKNRHSIKNFNTAEIETIDISIEEEIPKEPVEEEKELCEYNSVVDEDGYDEKEDLENLVIIDEKDLEE